MAIWEGSIQLFIQSNAWLTANDPVLLPGQGAIDADNGTWRVNTDLVNSANWSTLTDFNVSVGGSKHTIQDEGLDETDRTNLNFVGATVLVTDNPGNDSSDVTISAAPVSHTHTAVDVTDFDTEVSNNASVTANTAKVTNATHTGEITGSGALTLDVTAISNQTLVTGATGDHLIIRDATDGALKKIAIDDLALASHTHTASEITDFDTEVSNNADVAANTTHRTSDGSDHTFIDQDVTSGSSPTLDGTNITGLPVGSLPVGNAGEQLTTNEAETALEFQLASKYIQARKGSAGTIAKGAPVYISGWNVGQSAIEVEEADASSAATMPAVGLAFESITNSANSRVIISGNTVGIVDTSSFTEGDAIYVSETTGALTNTKPTGAALIQKIGTVGRAHASAGQMTVIGAGRSNDLPNLPNTKIWIGDASGVPQSFAMSGDGTMTAGGVFTIGTDAITYAKMQNVVADNVILGNNSGAGGIVDELTAAEVRTIINVEDGADVTDATNVNAAGATMNTDSSLVGNTYFLDEDTMTSNDATKIASQQSIKAYVDAEVSGKTESFIIACSGTDEVLTTGTAKETFRMPYAFTVTDVRASLTTAGTGAALVTVDINEGGVSILSTKITIDATETTSTTAATAPVISDSALADAAEITIDIDTVDTDNVAAGLKVYIIGNQ